MSENPFDEKVVPGALKDLDQEELEVYQFKQPSAQRMLTKRRIAETEAWAAKQGWIEYEELVAYIKARWQLNRAQCRELASTVLEDFKRLGKVRGQHQTAKKYQF